MSEIRNLHKRIRIALRAEEFAIEKFDRQVEELLNDGWTLNSVVTEVDTLSTWLYYIFTRETLKAYTGPR